jgi:hypothetical protein
MIAALRVAALVVGANHTLNHHLTAHEPIEISEPHHGSVFLFLIFIGREVDRQRRDTYRLRRNVVVGQVTLEIRRESVYDRQSRNVFALIPARLLQEVDIELA